MRSKEVENHNVRCVNQAGKYKWVQWMKDGYVGNRDWAKGKG